ncbi:Protein TIC 22, chloroplastic [Vitis vinifera]|uniref:Protein TIC 22, chloroplastic n=1 Tax=Vitis vinifera TaxID=29760 RepID=A0A438DD44_VITVI|nr:Protein TIC 22, chloroplastic [Vitis vinifera]
MAKSLVGTVVYTISNSNNEFVLIFDPDGIKSIGLLYFRQEDVETFLSQSVANRELRSQTRVCCKEENKGRRNLGKLGRGGRRFRLERLANEAGVFSTEDKVGSDIASVKEGRKNKVQVEEEEKKQFFIEVTAVVSSQGKEWLNVRYEEGLDSHVGSSVGPSREQVKMLGNGAVGLVGEGRAEQVGVVSNLYGMGMAGGAEAGVGKYGKGSLNEVRAPVVKTSCLERRLVEEILGVAVLAKARRKFGVDESLSDERRVGRPLRVIWADENEREVSIDLKKGAKEYDGRVLPKKDVERVLEEEEWSVLGLWMNDSFVKLYYCLSMPTEGFEGEILLFWRRMEETKILRVIHPKKKRKIQKVSRLERKLKKLECSMNYSGIGRNVMVLQLAN